jgi:hypothetical protein
LFYSKYLSHIMEEHPKEKKKQLNE